MTDTDRLAALIADAWPLGKPEMLLELTGKGTYRERRLADYLAARLITAGVTLAATPAPLDELDIPPTIAEAYEQGMLATRARHAALVAAAREVCDVFDNRTWQPNDVYGPLDALRAALKENRGE